jgi:fructuronate reductase
VQALDRRRRDSGAPLTIICCDNLPSNGRVLGALVDDFAARLPGGVALQTWIAGHVRFPSTMVDRIVPATTDGDRAAATRALGVEDRGLVVTEPFTQWVIEDAFAAPRPAWERAGAVLVNDVAPYEQIKLRMLNGSHSLLAYLGQLADCELVSDAVADDGLRAAATGLMASDVAPTLNVPDGVDLAGYQHDLLARFANPALRHRTAQIAMDGSQKLPQRLLGTIRDRRRAGAEPALAALGVAAWMRYVSARRSDSGRPLTIDDPLADVIAERVGERSDPGAVVDGLLGMRAVFPEDLASDEPLRTQLIELVQRLAADGAAATAARITGERSAA